MGMQLPLAGLTVIAIEQAIAAPFCTSRLADAGVRVGISVIDIATGATAHAAILEVLIGHAASEGESAT